MRCSPVTTKSAVGSPLNLVCFTAWATTCTLKSLLCVVSVLRMVRISDSRCHWVLPVDVRFNWQSCPGYMKISVGREEPEGFDEPGPAAMVVARVKAEEMGARSVLPPDGYVFGAISAASGLTRAGIVVPDGNWGLTAALTLILPSVCEQNVWS